MVIVFYVHVAVVLNLHLGDHHESRLICINSRKMSDEGPKHLHLKYPFVIRPARLYLYTLINMHGTLKNIMKLRTNIKTN